MPEIVNDGVRISYDAAGDGRPLIMLHGWVCDRTWWSVPGYVDDLRRDHRVITVDWRGFGASDKPADPNAYHIERLTSDVVAIADAEGFDRFAVWGESYGGWIAWMTAAAHAGRVAALISGGHWRPMFDDHDDWVAFDESALEAIRTGGMRKLLDLFADEEGDRFASEFPTWAQEVILRNDPAAAIACMAWDVVGVTTKSPGLPSVAIPTLLIAGELEDPNDEAAAVAQSLPNAERFRPSGLGHAGAAIASDLALPVARSFLDRAFPQPISVAPAARRSS